MWNLLTSCRLWRSELVFCAALAAALVGCRLAFFDYEHFFTLRHAPNHDMLAAAPFFCTNVHSARIEGEIAWWNPVSYGGLGYAQYYQSFLSPLAPTNGHPPFFLWMQVVWLLGRLGIAIPEYGQYLVFTYVLLPFLTFSCFAAFVRQICRRRLPVVLATVAYALSGVGLWNGSWFYFQESFTLFFLLASWTALLRRPTFPRAALLLTAVLVQVASLNYWSVYNSWFLVIIVVIHGWVYRVRLEHTRRWALAWVNRHRAVAGTIACAIVACVGLWLAILVSVYLEQRSASFRPGRTYTMANAYARVQETSSFTIALFDPHVDRASARSPVFNPMHHARYIGIVFLPLLALMPFYRWGRTERWLVVAAMAVLCVCLAPPFLLAAWKLQPGMDRIVHLFYFYSHFWQTVLILLGALSLDRLLRGLSVASNHKTTLVIVVALGLAVLLFIVAWLVADFYPLGNSTLESMTRAALLLLVASGILLQVQRTPPRRRVAWAALLVLIGFTDLSRYFMEVSARDLRFTQHNHPARRSVPPELPAAVVKKLHKPWKPGIASHGFGGGIAANLPLTFEFWPDNTYLLPQRIIDEDIQEPMGFPSQGPAQFHASAVEVGEDRELWALARRSPERFLDHLYLHDAPARLLQTATDSITAQVSPVTLVRWGYNDFTLHVTAPEDGWVLLHLAADPLWKAAVDGRPVPPGRANLFRLAIPITKGEHSIDLSYCPLARRLFWPACWLLEAILCALAILVFLRRVFI